jgi:hypothetical protein
LAYVRGMCTGVSNRLIVANIQINISVRWKHGSVGPHVMTGFDGWREEGSKWPRKPRTVQKPFYTCNHPMNFHPAKQVQPYIPNAASCVKESSKHRLYDRQVASARSFGRCRHFIPIF